MNVSRLPSQNQPFFETKCSVFQTANRRTQALRDEFQKVKQLTRNLRHMEDTRKIGDVRVCKQEHLESPQIDAF